MDSTNTKSAIPETSEGSFRSVLRSLFNYRPFAKKEANATDVALQTSVVRLYNRCSDVDFLRFLKTFNMTDTLGTWFMITGLHVWFVLLRLRQEPDAESEGFENFRDAFLDVLWMDAKKRLELISKHNIYMTRGTIKDEMARYYAYLTTSMIELDEGIMSDDKVLAGALWRLFYKTQQVDDVVALNRLVRYVRAQVYHLNRRTIEDIIATGIDKWEVPSES